MRRPVRTCCVMVAVVMSLLLPVGEGSKAR